MSRYEVKKGQLSHQLQREHERHREQKPGSSFKPMAKRRLRKRCDKGTVYEAGLETSSGSHRPGGSPFEGRGDG